MPYSDYNGMYGQDNGDDSPLSRSDNPDRYYGWDSYFHADDFNLWEAEYELWAYQQ